MESIDINIKNEFTKNLEELLQFFMLKKKSSMTRFLENNFKENIHYIKIKNTIKISERWLHICNHWIFLYWL